MLEAGRPGELYLIGGDAGETQSRRGETICSLMGQYAPGATMSGRSPTSPTGQDMTAVTPLTSPSWNVSWWRSTESFATGLERRFAGISTMQRGWLTQSGEYKAVGREESRCAKLGLRENE